MTAAHRRHDMSDAVWERLRSHLPGPEERASGEDQPMTTAGSSTPFAGSCEPVPLGGICRRTTETGRTPTGDSPERRGKSVHRRHKRGLNSKLHMATDSHGMPVRLAVTEGTAADSCQALSLIEGTGAERLPAS